MYFKFKCPECDKSLKVREEIAGRKVACPYCSTAIQVPAPPPPVPPPQESDGLSDLKTTSKRTADRRKAAASSVGGYSDGTDVSMLVSGAIGAGLAIGFLALLFPLRNFYFGELFLDRGWVPFALVFLMAWSVAILLLKWRKLKRQKQSMLFDLLPTELSEDISVDSLDRFHAHIHALPVEPGSSFLINRVVRGLEHFAVRKSNPEVAGMLASQSEIDANAVESSYTLLKVFIWAIPILGFIGTVIGISEAVGGFSGSLDKAQDISVLKDSLNNVTGGLSTAFDTTLVALVMSMLVMFPASSMQKSEEDLLNWVDEYCNENLLKRLADGRDEPERPAGDARAVRRAIDAAMAAHHAELQSWTAKLERIGGTLSQQVVKGWEQIDRQLLSQHEAKQEEFKDLGQMADEFRSAITKIAEQTERAEKNLAASMNDSADSLRECLTNLEIGLASLAGVLETLGEKQVLIQQQPAPRRGWFFSRSNGG